MTYSITRKQILIPFALIALVFMVLNGVSFHVLTAVDLRNHHIYYASPIETDDQFSMTWIHSVELEPWTETFRVDEQGDIFLVSTQFRAFGAGMPASAGTNTDVSDGQITFSGIDERMDALNYGISPVAQHSLEIHGTTVPLYDLMPPDTGVRIVVQRLSLWRILMASLNGALFDF